MLLTPTQHQPERRASQRSNQKQTKQRMRPDTNSDIKTSGGLLSVGAARRRPGTTPMVFFPDFGDFDPCAGPTRSQFSWPLRETHKQNSHEISGKCRDSSGAIPGKYCLCVFLFIVFFLALVTSLAVVVSKWSRRALL